MSPDSVQGCITTMLQGISFKTAAFDRAATPPDDETFFH